MIGNKYVFDIEDMEIPYTVIVNKKLKYMRVAMDTDGMTVSVPCLINSNKIEELLKSKKKWIYEHYLRLQSVKSKECKRNWVSGEKVLFRGNAYNINVFNIEGSGARVGFDGQEFHVYIGNSLSIIDRDDIITMAFRKLYIKISLEIVNKRIIYYSKVIGVSYNNIRIKEQKTRWGSCSKKSNLNFNWKLIMAPEWVLDYVVIHELCHLKHLNHSKDFWSTVEEFMPEYKEARIWLKDNGSKLKI